MCILFCIIRIHDSLYLLYGASYSFDHHCRSFRWHSFLPPALQTCCLLYLCKHYASGFGFTYLPLQKDFSSKLWLVGHKKVFARDLHWMGFISRLIIRTVALCCSPSLRHWRIDPPKMVCLSWRIVKVNTRIIRLFFICIVKYNAFRSGTTTTRYSIHLSR